MTRNYKDTLFLPKTDFSLQGVKDEAAIRQRFGDQWHTYSNSGSRSTFRLHDGPPYANGDIHMGHALNKILKDFILRSQFGKDVEYRPGWDCHGLPIESQVEKNLMAEGKSKADYTAVEFRDLCREYATGWVDAQREQFKELGVVGNWDKPYLTMDYAAEARIAAVLHTFLMEDRLYRGTKPVLWSTVEETALAEAEVEHHDLKVTSVYVRFVVKADPRTSVVIWTTTPWTLPANRAVAFNSDIEYAVYELQNGERLAVARNLVEEVMKNLKVTKYREVGSFDPRSVICEHPLRGYFEDGYDFDVPLIEAAHVTNDTGTGFVHIAPEHGPDDFICYKGVGEVPTTVLADGKYAPDVVGFAGVSVLEQTPKGDYIFEFTNAKIVKALEANGTLLSSEKVTISYPHSWRSKAPLIYRNTPQWFLKIDDKLRAEVLEALDETMFFPESGGNRLINAVGSRPDWLISRQRVWGTPMALVVNKTTGEPVKSGMLNKIINNLFAEKGGNAWWECDLAALFTATRLTQLDPNDYEKVYDVLDVWFDSGCSHSIVMGMNGVGVRAPHADLYLEGSDQARGWFSSSSLVSMALNDQLPFEQILTHGFVLDHNGKKMSKSVGNVVDPRVEAQKYGTDVLRLWVALSDYTQDTRVGPQILQTTADQYKKLRNTFRFLVANLQGMDGKSRHDLLEPISKYPPLECYILFLLHRVTEQVKVAYRQYRFGDACKIIMDFCSNDLSAFYFDARKDTLYCDHPESHRRLATLTTLFILMDTLSVLLMPILPFTVTEAEQELGWTHAKETAIPWSSGLEDFGEQFEIVRSVLSMVMTALEEKRNAKEIGSGMDAHVIVQLPAAQFAAFHGIDDVADVFRVSQATITESPDLEATVTVVRAEGQKCARSRRITTDVGSDPRYPDLSARDAEAVAYWDSKNAG